MPTYPHTKPQKANKIHNAHEHNQTIHTQWIHAWPCYIPILIPIPTHPSEAKNKEADKNVPRAPRMYVGTPEEGRGGGEGGVDVTCVGQRGEEVYIQRQEEGD